MSNLNQKGPMGEGSMTGRGMGRCTNFGAARKNRDNQETRNANNLNATDAPHESSGRRRGCGMGRAIQNRTGANRKGEGMNQDRGGRGRSRGGGRGRGMGRRFADNIQE